MTATRRALICSIASLIGMRQLMARESPDDASPIASARQGLRILFLGGTGFIGPHMVREALARGHKVTIFSRGQTGNGLFPEVERLVGDRASNLDALRGKTWDVVIDNIGFVPAHVRASAELLKGSVGHYLFTSTIDVYKDYHALNIDEEYPLATLPPDAPHDVNKYYGPLKALCEEIVASIYPGQHTIVRPSWIAGPGDNLHFFTYWTMRLDRGGEVLTPGKPDDAVQIIDARDLATWVIAMVEKQKGGRYNAAGPSMTFLELLNGIRKVTRAPTTFTWVDADFLLRNKVVPYTEMPLWCSALNDGQRYSVPVAGGLACGIGAFTINDDKARKAGLTHRPLSEVAEDTLQWYKAEYKNWPNHARNQGLAIGLTAAREQELLAAWKALRASRQASSD